MVGYGGHAKSVADCIERAGKYKIAGYTDITPHNSKYTYLGTDDVLEKYFEKGIKRAAVGIGYLGKGDIRERLYIKLKQLGYILPIISDPSAIICETAQLGEGTFVGKGAIVNAEAKIGEMVIVNTMALIEHECVIGSYTHIAVSAVLCGQVEVGSAVFVGANATITQSLYIPSRAVIPAGETLRRNYYMHDHNGYKIISNDCNRGGNLPAVVRQAPKIGMNRGAA